MKKLTVFITALLSTAALSAGIYTTAAGAQGCANIAFACGGAPDPVWLTCLPDSGTTDLDYDEMDGWMCTETGYVLA